MADQSHLDILSQGVEAWNEWRTAHPEVRHPDLSGADLEGASLSYTRLRRANLSGANLRKADLQNIDLFETNLRQAHLEEADLRQAKMRKAHLEGAYLFKARLLRANLSKAHLQKADLREADFRQANLSEARLDGADLKGTKLTSATLVETNLEQAILSGTYIYGLSAWDIQGTPKEQTDLIITPEGKPEVKVDNLEVAQFVYLLLNNEKIRIVLDTIGDKGVLILGRFTEERKQVLDAIRDRLRDLGFVPMMFDFERPTQRDFTDTIKTLAGLSRFIIADITNPRSAPLELQATMPDYMIPFVPIIHQDEEPFAMFRDLQQKYGEWVLKPLKYDSAANLQEALKNAVVEPALEKSNQLILKKAEAIRTRHIRDYQ
jgi:hypothetical protein